MSTLSARAGDLVQHARARCSLYAPPRELAELSLQLRPYEETIKLLGRHTRSPRAGEGIEDEVSFSRRGQQSAAHEPQGLLGRMVAVKLLPSGDGGYAPDGGELGAEAVYEVVVEGVAGSSSPARPEQRLVGVGASQSGQRR